MARSQVKVKVIAVGKPDPTSRLGNHCTYSLRSEYGTATVFWPVGEAKVGDELEVPDVVAARYCECGHYNDMHITADLICKGDDDTGVNVENPGPYDKGGWCQCPGFRPLPESKILD